MEHDTVNKFIIVHRNVIDFGQPGSQFLGDEIIQNTASTNYFTITSIELHHVHEDIVTKQEPSDICDSTLLSGQKTTSEGGGDSYDHSNFISGFVGRENTLN